MNRVRVGSAAVLGIALALAGCVSVDSDLQGLRDAVTRGDPSSAVAAATQLAEHSVYSKNLGCVEAGRACMLAGDMSAAEGWFRKAVDSAIDRKESSPKLKLGDAANTALAATITDDRTREYYLEPYELNLALEYGIFAQLFSGRREDALVDARLSVYVQDSLAETYGADLEKDKAGDGQAEKASGDICEDADDSLAAMMAASRNSWENPVLWYLTGVLFEADGDRDFAWASYRKAAACRPGNPVFAAAAKRAGQAQVTPRKDAAKLVVIYEEGLVPLRESLKIPVPIYTAMSIDIPMYGDKSAYAPGAFAVSGTDRLVAGHPALDVRSLAARDLSERMPGVVARNITRGLAAAGAQAAVNCSNGNEYARLAVFAANAVAAAIRRADTRSWVTLPDGQQIWEEDAMKPGDYAIGVDAGGVNVQIPVSLRPGKTHFVWVARQGATVIYKETEL